MKTIKLKKFTEDNFSIKSTSFSGSKQMPAPYLSNISCAWPCTPNKVGFCIAELSNILDGMTVLKLSSFFN